MSTDTLNMPDKLCIAKLSLHHITSGATSQAIFYRVAKFIIFAVNAVYLGFIFIAALARHINGGQAGRRLTIVATLCHKGEKFSV